jgi:hypothetical protein
MSRVAAKARQRMHIIYKMTLQTAGQPLCVVSSSTHQGQPAAVQRPRFTGGSRTRCLTFMAYGRPSTPAPTTAVTLCTVDQYLRGTNQELRFPAELEGHQQA